MEEKVLSNLKDELRCIKEKSLCLSSNALLYRLCEVTESLIEEIERPAGEWIKRKSWDYPVCSKCSFELKAGVGNYCPNCGIKMKVENK